MKSFFINDGTEYEQLTFLEAIRLIEATPEEKSISVGSHYYDQLAANEKAFDQMVTSEEAVSIEKPIIAGNDAKIIRVLKALKNEPRLTDDQEEIIDILISRWENGDIPAKVTKDATKKMNVTTDSLELYYEILKAVPEIYLQETRVSKPTVDGKKQIILSCYLKSEGSK